MAPPVQPGDSFPDWAAQRQTSPSEIPRNDSTGPWSAQRQTSSRTNSKGRDVNAEAKHKMSWFAAGDRERQALLAAIERDYAPELRRISHDWVLSRGCKLQAESKNDDSDLAPPLPRYLDLSEVLGIPNVMLSAMLAAKCRDQNILATKERQQRFAEYVFANCAENSFKMKELHLGPDFAKAVALTLSFCSRYTELNLSGNALGDQGAQTMATLLLKTTTLTSVDLSALALLQLLPSSIGYSSSIDACHRSGEWQQALQLLWQAEELSLQPDATSCGLVVSSAFQAATSTSRSSSLVAVEVLAKTRRDFFHLGMGQN